MNAFKSIVYIINLEKRRDRKRHIIKQFKAKPEFEIHIVPGVIHKDGAMGLWQTMRKIIEQAKKRKDNYIIICEDDHLFTKHYSLDKLHQAIKISDELDADLLLGGVSYFDDAIEFNNSLFWLSGFTGLQFTIIYRRFYERFLNFILKEKEDIDLKMKDITGKIFCIYPFISVQKEFGYSDVTPKNKQLGAVEEYFTKSEKRLDILFFLRRYFDNLYRAKEHDV